MRNSILQKIKEQVNEDRRRGRRNLLVFDLDSTLFDVSFRSQKILLEFALNPDHQTRFPKETNLLKDVIIAPTDWGIRSSIERLPFEHPPQQDFLEHVKTFWMRHFFDSKYLDHDQPYPGAVEFVRFFANQPLTDIVYLTGRDIKRMLIGTERSLQLHGFPTPGFPMSSDASQGHVKLALKPDTHISDTDFKCQWFHQIEMLRYHHIWFFENEPANIDRVMREHPSVEIIFFDSTHSGKLPTPSHLPSINSYL